MYNWNITPEERSYLRELAKKQLEYSQLPIMKEREARWYRHNDLSGEIPMLHFEIWTCEAELLPRFRCTSEAAKAIELQLFREITNHELIDDDRVVPSWYRIGWDVKMLLFDLRIDLEHSTDSEGRDLGHKFKHPIKDLHEDMGLLKPTSYSVDRERTQAWKAFVEEILGDILPIRMVMGSLNVSLSQDIVHLMGMETMIYSLVDYPVEFYEMMKRMTREHLAYLKWMEAEGLLFLNNGNDCISQGTFGFNKTLPRDGFNQEKSVATQDVWGYMDSQETIGISPNMFGEFFHPFYMEVAQNFGLLNYGCCEPVNTIWEKYISKLPNLRKVSISPWCDEEYMGQALRGSKIIYHRKPSPNYIGVGKVFDEDAFRKHIMNTIQYARGCKLEFSFRDVYTVEGDIHKPGRAIKIVRELLEKYWQ